MAGPSDRCRLYLIVPPAPGPGMVRDLTEAMGAGDVACVLLRRPPAQAVDDDLARRLVETAQAHDAAVLIEDDVDAALTLGADGVHLTSAYCQDDAAFAAARKQLGEKAIIGVNCGLSRHSAMILGEAGADYVGFGRDDGTGTAGDETCAGLMSWWSELFQIPCVAWNAKDFDEAVLLAGAGADFVALERPVWGHEGGADAAVREMTARLGSTGGQKK